MNTNPSTRSTGLAVSSQLGRKWLEASEGRQPDDVLPTESSATEPRSKSSQPIMSNSFITIPDVGLSVGDAFTALDYSQMKDTAELERALSQASEQRLAENANLSSENDQPLNVLPSSDPNLVDSIRGIGSPGEPPEGQVRADLPEPPTEWTDKPATKETPRTETGQPVPKTSQNQAIEKLANAIVERFPLGDPTVLMFVGSESNNHIDETCARVASALAERRIGRIMLLDSDDVGGALSQASGVSGQPGITNVVNENVPWESVIYGRSATGLDFMAVGTGKYHFGSIDRLRNAVAEMKREYQFICLSAGDARSNSARIWNDVCDGSYLVVSMKNSNQTIAKSAVAEMQSGGARLLGCVVTDVD